MNPTTRQVYAAINHLAEDQAYTFTLDGDFIRIQVKAPGAPCPDLRLTCPDDGSEIVILAPELTLPGPLTPAAYASIFRLEPRFRFLRCLLDEGRQTLTLRLEFFMADSTIPPAKSPAYPRMLDLARAILAPAQEYLGTGLTTGVWPQGLIRMDPPGLKQLTQTIKAKEQDLTEHRRRADQLRKAVAPDSRILPYLL